MKKTLNLGTVLFIFAALLVLFASSNVLGQRQHNNWQSVGPERTPPVSTNTTALEVEVKGDGNEKLNIRFHPGQGTCQIKVRGSGWVNCDKAGYDAGIEVQGVQKSEVFFCTPADSSHPANTNIRDNNQIHNVYCGRVWYLTDGADIQFKPGDAPHNRKCKKVGGKVICY